MPKIILKKAILSLMFDFFILKFKVKPYSDQNLYCISNLSILGTLNFRHSKLLSLRLLISLLIDNPTAISVFLYIFRPLKPDHF
jgi:hypothetical protein